MPTFLRPLRPIRLQRKKVRVAVQVACLLYGLGGASSTFAALGESLAGNLPTHSSAPSRAAAAASRSSAAAAPSGLYTVYSSTLASGTVVTEYATPAGQVFAVAWKGPVLPELDALLGSYFSSFKSQADASRSSRSLGAPLRIDTPRLVLRTSGRMRNFSGHAHDPQLLPSGVALRDLLP